MDRKRIAVIAGTITGTLALASAAGAANFGLLRAADEEDVTPAVAADRIAERRIAAGGRGPWLPGDAVGVRPGGDPA